MTAFTELTAGDVALTVLAVVVLSFALCLLFPDRRQR